MMTEFELIQHYFAQTYLSRPDVTLGIGDDCAVVNAPVGVELAMSTDTLIEGVHFFADTDPFAIGYKALAVNLSDLAAVGAKPAWFSLALTLSDIEPIWLEDFSQGLLSLAQQYQLALIGGDTTRGSVLSITINIVGFLPYDMVLKRSHAQVGDGIYVTGELGDASLMLKALTQQITLTNEQITAIQSKLYYPQPRVLQGEALRKLGVHASIDISDGLTADLGHILTASNVGACLYLEKLPLSATLKNYIHTSQDWSLPLNGGDDYELCFTLAVSKQATLNQLSQHWDCACTQIGVIEEEQGLRLKDLEGSITAVTPEGYQHF